MPAFNVPKNLDLLGRFIIPGKKVYVDTLNGDDTFDGSENWPYATLARGVADLRNGRNDFLIYLNTAAVGVGVAEDPVVISGLSSFGIVGLGLPGILPPASHAALVVPTVWTRNTAILCTVTVPAGHGAQVGDYYFVHGVAQSGDTRLRGVARVNAVTATTIQLRPHVVGAAGNQPYTAPGALGFLTPCPLVFEGCTNVVVAGLAFVGELSDSMSGLVVSGGSSAANVIGTGYSITRNAFLTANLGFYNLPAAPNLSSAGTLISVEGNVFSPNLIGGLTVNAATTSYVWLSGMIEPVFHDNVFQMFTASISWTGAAFIEHAATNPGAGYQFSGNRILSANLPAAKLIRSNEASGGGGRIFFEGNFYADVLDPRESFLIDPNGQIRERLSARSAQQDYNASPLDVVRRGSGAVAAFRVTGGSASAVQTNATQASGWYNGARIVCYGVGAGAAAHAEVESYSSTSGTFTLEDALPFTPAVGDVLLVLSNHADVARDVWEAALPGAFAAGTAGERLATAEDAAEKIRKVTTNRVLVNSIDSVVTVFENDGTTPAFSFTISGDRRERVPV